MIKIFPALITFLLMSLTSILSGQSDVRENYIDAEFFLSEEDYKEALIAFQKVYKAGYQENANINYRIGICYLNIPGQKEKSVPFLKKAVSNISKNWVEGSFKEITAPPDAYLYLGNAYRISYQLDDAIISYKKYQESLDNSMIADNEFTNQQIQACEHAKKIIQNPVTLFKENFGTKISSNNNNSHLVISGDKNSMAYISHLRFYDAVFFVKKIYGKWSNSINITPQIESDGDQYACSLSFDGQKLYLVKMSNFDADIYVSNFSMGKWMPSKSLGRPVNSKYFESHASIAPDGKTLYFTSNRTESLGGMDIFISNLNDKGDWSDVVNIGATINTTLNEETPFLAADGKTLYFSSQGHETIGGYDIFKTIKQEDGTWSKPVDLPYPINTTDDDMFFFPTDNENSGYLTLYEPNALGLGNLYYIEVISETLAVSEGKRVLSQEAKQFAGKEAEAKAALVKPTEQVLTETPEKKADVTPSIKYNLKPIYFDYNSYTLSENSKAKLKEILKILTIYPELKLEVRGYTDARGTFNYNQTLSEKRAKAIVDYLVSKGAGKIRFLIKGLSESEKVAINKFADGRDAVEGRKLNRRVEFRIVKKGGALLQIEPVKVPKELKVN